MMDFNSLLEQPWDLVVRILVAAAFGGILGIERDIHGRGAGLRTHLLVSAGAALFMILSTHAATFDAVTPTDFTKVADPGRIAAQIVTGIGFIGAGVILKEGLTIRGLTTAACLWIAAAIGMASGAGQYFIATMTTLLALFTLIFLRYLEKYYGKHVYRNLEVKVPNEVDIQQLIDAVINKKVRLINFDVERDLETQSTSIRMYLRLFYKDNADKMSCLIIDKLEKSPIPLKAIRWLRP
jgi:putative Mg2+ transporter-C (MgtC) family protein